MFKSSHLKSLLFIPIFFETHSLGFLNLHQALEIGQPVTQENIISQNRQELGWNQFLNLFKSKKRKAVTRTGSEDLCIIGISPDLKNQIWSSKPLFVWQGNLQRIKISNDSQVFWDHVLTEDERKAERAWYNSDKELGQGEQYYFEYYLETSENPKTLIFTVLNLQDHENLRKKLIEIDGQINKNSEEIALQKALKFLEYEDLKPELKLNLSLDALRELYFVPNPSKDLEQKIQLLKQYTCSKNNVSVDSKQ